MQSIPTTSRLNNTGSYPTLREALHPTPDPQFADQNRKVSKSAAETQIQQFSNAQKQAELSNRIRGLRLKVECRAISNQFEMMKVR